MKKMIGYLYWFLLFAGCSCFAAENKIPLTGVEKPMTVDFGYAFATPHRITVCLPNSSDKTLLDAFPNYLRMAWTYDNLLDKPLGSFTTPRTTWDVRMKAEIDGRDVIKSSWCRADGWLPVLKYGFQDSIAGVTLQVVGAQSAAIVKILVENREQKPHRITLHCERPGGLTGFNPAWVQTEWDRDVLLAGWFDRADRIIVFTLGSDENPVIGATTVSMAWNLGPGEKKTGWLIRPYRAYQSMLPALRGNDWAAEFNAAEEAWRSLIDRAGKVTIPDPGIQNAFYAGLADCFVMREPVSSEYIAGTPGTEVYRAPNSGEPAIAAILMDQVGLHTESAIGFQMCIDQQGPDGNWADPLGWGHYWWGSAGFKSWPIMEHYRLTGDKAYLAAVYPRMLASSHWQDKQRRQTRIAINGERPLTYGLMPRGMGDCGLKDDDDLYGVFLPHNMFAVYADAATLEAARILGKSEDIAELQSIHSTALADLLQALDRGAISENGYRWIPGVAGKTCGSRWGALYAVFPLNILPRDHELINGTIQKIESRISPGGIPVNTGWMKDGMWVAITLDNLAEVLLLQDQADKAAKYLYATINHGTPLYSWCEERGQEPGSKEITGDRQHLWTPLAVSRYIRDALVMEDGETLHLARGIARQWLSTGQPLGVKGMVTHFGIISYEMQYQEKTKRVVGTIMLDRACNSPTILHLRLPVGKKIKSISTSSDAVIANDGESIVWSHLPTSTRFEAVVK